MNDRIPTEQELDTLLDAPPRFDPEAVKRRTMARIASSDTPDTPPRSRRRFPLRGLCIAAVVCALSVSAMAAADFATSGLLSQALGLVPREAPAPALPEEPSPVLLPVTPAPQTPEKEEPEVQPELDEQLKEALSLSPDQTKVLRPAVQSVNGTAEQQGIRMTVLQTLGDANQLYIKLRFDFSKEVPHSGYLDFHSITVSISGAEEQSWHADILDQDARSVTYLLSTFIRAGTSLSGRTITVSAEDYGHSHIYTEQDSVELNGTAGHPFALQVLPDGTQRQNLSEEQIAALPAPVSASPICSEGFTIQTLTDGSYFVRYDGAYDQSVTILLSPNFDTVIPGKWEHSWVLDYQDLSRKWEGSDTVFSPCLTMSSFFISPLSWRAAFTAREEVGSELGAGLIYTRNWNAQLLYADGTQSDLALSFTGVSSSSSIDGNTCITEFNAGNTFDSPIDLTGVTAIILDGKEFPLS